MRKGVQNSIKISISNILYLKNWGVPLLIRESGRASANINGDKRKSQNVTD